MTDFEDVSKVVEQMRKARASMYKLIPEVAKATRVKEFIGEARKNLLSEFVQNEMDRGESATAAEHRARANPEYRKALRVLEDGFQSAVDTLKQDSWADKTFEEGRSLLSYNREKLRQEPE